LLGAASVITRVSDTVTVFYPKGTSANPDTGIGCCAEKGKAAAPGGNRHSGVRQHHTAAGWDWSFPI